MSKISDGRGKFFPVIKIHNYIYICLLIIIPLVLNWKNISYEFTTLDDILIITNNNSFLNNFKNVFQAFEKDNFISKEGNIYYRPIQTVSFMVDAQVSREKPYAYHFSNILYHILTVIVLFFLLRKLGVRDNISFFISLLFSVHPLFTDAIAWIPGRGDLLCGLFCSVSFLSFLYCNSSKNKWFFFFHSAAFMLALFSKETSVFLPVIIIFYYWVVLKNRYQIRMLVPFISVWGFSVCLFFLLRHFFLHYQDILSVKAFIRNFPVIPIFLGKLVLPLGLSPMPVYNTIFTFIGLILLISSGICIWKLRAGNKSLITLGIVWFLGFIIPAMFVELSFSKVHFDYLECRAYLPSIGIFIAIGVLLNEIILRKGLDILLKIFIPVILIFSAISYTYAGDYKNGVSFFSSLIKSDPGNVYAIIKRGGIYLSKNNLNLAFADFDYAIKVNPTYSEPYYNYGVLYNSKNDHVMAEHFYTIALNYDTLYPGENNLNEKVYINLSSEKYYLKKYIETITLLKSGIRKYPGNCTLHISLGSAYFYNTGFDSALYEFNKGIELEQNVPLYYNYRGMTKYHLDDFAGALNDFNRAIELKPAFFDALGNRGKTKIKLNDYEGAVSDLTRVISVNPGIGAAYYFRGMAFSKLNRLNEAKLDWKKAAELGYKSASDLLHNSKI